MSMNPRLLRPTASGFSPRSIPGLALWLDAADPSVLFTTDAGPVTAVSSPLDIAGCALWLDGADSSAASMTLNGSLVETWKDKGGNGRDFTATSTARPTLTASAINSRSALTFNGATNTMTGNAAAQDVIRNLAGYTAFSVLRTASVAGGERLAFGVGLTVLFRFGQQDSRLFMGGRRVAGDTLESITEGSGTIIAGTTFIQTAVVNHSSQSLTGIRNGAAFATDATYMAAGSSENVAAAVSIGTQAGGTYGFWNGEIAELIVYPTALTTADRARVESYLAAKWGIAGVHAPATASSDPVGYWGDKSGNNRHAVQATAGNRPTISATAQNGRKILALDGTNDSFNGPAGFSLTDTHTVIAAVRPDVRKIAGLLGGSVTATNLIYGDGSASFSGSRFGAFGIARAVFGGGGITAGAFQVFSAVLSGGTLPTDLSMFTNGAGGAVSTETAGTAPGAAMTANLLLGTTQGNQFWDGDIAEMLIWGRAITTAERQRAERYLALKYGITLAPLVANADAQDWVNRVYANGGTVSTSTAQAVDTFCGDIESAGIRDRFFRLNLFCGTGLNAALVPLYRGPSLGGTQYGGATDNNNGPFVSGDFSDSTGLAAGSGKYLRTGLTQGSVGVASHLSFYDCVKPTNAYANRIGSRGAGDQNEHAITNIDVAMVVDYASGVVAGIGRARATGYTQSGGFWLGVNPTATSAILYKNGVSAATATPSARTAQSVEYWVFALNANGSIDSPMTTGRAGGYSIGLSMDATQAAAYNTAMQAFQTSLTRNA